MRLQLLRPQPDDGETLAALLEAADVRDRSWSAGGSPSFEGVWIAHYEGRALALAGLQGQPSTPTLRFALSSSVARGLCLELLGAVLREAWQRATGPELRAQLPEGDARAQRLLEDLGFTAAPLGPDPGWRRYLLRSPARSLAARQLAHYNAADLDGFCDCYHPDVVVETDGVVTTEGKQAFRANYAPMFAAGGFSATVDRRVTHPGHCVDREQFRRATGETGQVLVHYSVREGRIGTVRFWR